MAEKRGKRRPADHIPADLAVVFLDESEPDDSLPESQLARLQLRQRWELASVLNFLHVFKELIGRNLKISAEEIETALISPNGDLAQIHISLLMGIPPITKNLKEADAWVIAVSKKLATWWPWVAEGENPLEADHGDEVARYEGLDPTTRLLILKALCEVRALQEDISRYINDGLKNGIPITAFRKDRIGGDEEGITFWYDGDPVIGYRLYRETAKIESKQKKGKGYPVQSTTEPQWKTLAANLEEFWRISDILLSSKNIAEAAVGEIVKTDVIPVLEELHKKKEQALKRQQRQALQLDSFLTSSGIGAVHSRRERKPVKYTFDEYDQAIEEAIKIPKKSKTIGNEKAALNGCTESDKENSILDEYPDDVSKHRGPTGDDEDDDDDDDDDNAYEEDDNFDSSNADEVEENDSLDGSNDEGGPRRVRTTWSQKDVRAEVAVGLRRSRRTARSTNGSHTEAKGHGEMKNRPRQRPTPNTDNCVILSDSDD